MPLAHAHCRADVVWRQDNLAKVLEQARYEVLAKTLAWRQIERKSTHIAKVIHHAFKHYLEQFILRALVPDVNINTAYTASTLREYRATPRVIVLRSFCRYIVTKIIFLVILWRWPFSQESVLEVPYKQLSFSFRVLWCVYLRLFRLRVVVFPKGCCLYRFTRLFDTSSYRYGCSQELLSIFLKLLVALVCIHLCAWPVVSNIGQHIKANHRERGKWN